MELYKNYLINIKADDKNRDNIFDLFKNYYYVSNDNDFFLNRIRLVFDDFIFNKSIKIGYMNYLNSVTSSNETYYISDVYHSISNKRFFNEDEQFDYSNKTHMNKFIDFYILNRNNILEKYIKPFLIILLL
ncbi:hypothetical protein [Spiroplasma endosymbiont of Cantharis rufa]|uniref:hypothetical protein n=1 Tax=Spiroplasma endosymbiont of Cantharis rufa TaxID=3066279 RepID=UPI0030CFC22A